jgi:hypothetical protein
MSFSGKERLTMPELRNLRQQVSGLIDTCETVLTGWAKDLPPVDETTLEIAQAIISEVKAQLPGDKVLVAVSLALPVSWSSLLSAMQIIQNTLPYPRQGQIQMRTGGRYTG